MKYTIYNLDLYTRRENISLSLLFFLGSPAITMNSHGMELQRRRLARELEAGLTGARNGGRNRPPASKQRNPAPPIPDILDVSDTESYI